MRVYAILAHPQKNSLNGRIFYACVEALRQQGATVDVLDLYQHLNHIPFYVPSIKTVSSELDQAQLDFFNANKERFMAADRLFIVYPVYWYAVPGILKCWLDLITNFAWQYQSGNHRAQALHKIKRAFVINTASMPNWFRWLMTRNSATAMMQESFKFMSLNKFHFYEIGNTSSLTPANIEKIITKAQRLCAWLLD